MNKKNPKVDGYIRKNKQWSAELSTLREIVLDSELTEDVKWRVPCYTLNGKNVAFIGTFKESCALSFIKGVLMKDPKKILQMPGENTQSARVIRFKTIAEIEKLAPTLKAYVKEAVALEKSGAKVDMKAKHELVIPEELQKQFDRVSGLFDAFHALTPGRKRMYVMHFSSAKQAKTREARVEKYTQQILDGKGMDD